MEEREGIKNKKLRMSNHGKNNQRKKKGLKNKIPTTAKSEKIEKENERHKDKKQKQRERN